MNQHFTIEAWQPTHPRWRELVDAVAEQGQSDWVNFTAEWHHSSHMLVAQQDGEILGFLRFVVQEIGPDNDCPPVQRDGQTLREAKVLAFAVEEAHRRHGVGRALQERLIDEAKALGLFQIRSHSSGDNAANHQLKLAMGYGAHPIIRGDDTSGAYFILPLGVPASVAEL